MKKLNLFSAFFLLFAFAGLFVSAQEPVKTSATMPENVKSIIDKSCFGCHNSESQNEDAKEDLNFTTFNELSTIKKLGTLKHISEAVEKGEMPPKRFLERFPDKKITEEEAKILTEWVKTESETLIKQ